MSDTIKKSLWAAVDEHCAEERKTLAALQEAAEMMSSLIRAASLDQLQSDWMIYGPSVKANFTFKRGHRLHVCCAAGRTNFDGPGITLTLYASGNERRVDHSSSVADAVEVLERWRRVS